MADAATQPAPVRRGWRMALLRLVALVLLGLAAFAGLGLLVIDSPLGHRLVADRVAALRLPSGLAITIGRIDGTLFGASQLHDVVLSDPQGRFMTVPDVNLDWRPGPALRLALGLGGGLDIRDLALHRGLLLRAPRLNPADPNAPILPDFDIRIDRLTVDGLTVAPGLAGARRRIDLTAQAHVHDGRVIVACDGRLGGRDRLSFNLDSEPDRDRFALHLDYHAPQGGLLSALSGVHHTVDARIGGAGRFAQWRGWFLADADGRRMIGGQVDNRAGQYRLAALIRPTAAFGGWGAQWGGDRLGLTFAGTFSAGRIAGRIHAANALGRVDGTGAVDLVRNRAQAVALDVQLLHPEFMPAAWRDVLHPGPARMAARLDGAFTDLSIMHDLTVTRLDTAVARLAGLHTAGVAHWRGSALSVPLMVGVQRVDTGTPWLDARLGGARLAGSLRIGPTTLSGDGWRVTGRGLTANLALKGDMRRGGYALAGRVDARGLDLPRLGTVDGTAKGVLAFGNGVPWTIAVNYAGTAGHFQTAGMTAIAGDHAKVSGSLHWGANRALVVPNLQIASASLTASAQASYGPGTNLTVTTSGHHTDYGAFDAHLAVDRAGTTGQAHLADPLPAAGVRAVAIDLTGTPGGYRVMARATSRLGPLAATVDIARAPGTDTRDPMRITLSDARVFATNITGGLALDPGGLDGDLALHGGGIDGTVHFAGGTGGQAIVAMIKARAAHFDGDRPITVGLADVALNALFAPAKTTLNGSLKAQGLGMGGLFVGRLLADASMVNGSGSITASLSGRRGTRLALQASAAFTPAQVTAYLAGDYAGNTISMPRRAVLDRDGQGWRLQPSQVNFGSGAVIANGRLGNGPTDLHLAVSRMPLSALDIVYADLGLGGYVSGVIDYRNDHTGVPEGHAALSVMGLTRSGLVLTSRPLDLALVGQLDARALQVRAVAREGTVPRMRLQALIGDLPRGGSMIDRLRAGALRGQLRYAGPADALWRLAAIDAFDLTGPIGIAADVGGSLDAPVLSGAVISHNLRAQSAISGSDIKAIDLAGSFNDTRLSLAHVSGTTANGGHVAGSGTIDFSDVSSERPRIDLRLGATGAELVNRPEMGATITGPMRIVSDGHSGTVAGRLHIDRARWVLGRTSAVQSLPVIAVTERNTPLDVAPAPARGAPWKLLIDATGANRIDVHGMGLESEWQTDVHLRGDTTSPQIFGTAEVISGSYEFAGKRFDLTRGRIRFNGETPIDPQLDIIATGDANDISATISIGGSAQHPQISFASVPALPEEELLSRILFGS